MRTSVIVGISIAGFGFALWLARGGDPPASVAAGSPPPIVAASAAARALPVAATSATPTAVAPVVRKLDPKSERYAHRMDDQIPQRLYGMASHCYKGGSGRDQRLDVTYKVHVSEGAVSTADVRDDELPNLSEDGDLFMRVEGFSSYLANAEDDDATGGDTMN